MNDALDKYADDFRHPCSISQNPIGAYHAIQHLIAIARQALERQAQAKRPTTVDAWASAMVDQLTGPLPPQHANFPCEMLPLEPPEREELLTNPPRDFEKDPMFDGPAHDGISGTANF